MSTIAPEKKQTVTVTYSRVLDNYYSLLEDEKVMQITNIPGKNSLTVWRKGHELYDVVRSLSMRKDTQITEEVFCQAVEEYFKSIQFPCSITLNK